ncbi:long polar fimbria major subunit LpfA [Salmonella enterica subsp. enterica serovar Newport]|nr:long polar fimbria major subunit LpfA [Salmonella enterica subsp. enterica serovar Newport]ECN4024273.1 long polar fimbria major subunit LpfA [Salmonella enterica subsp. enterica serovar Newport]ECN9094901.1 long polar fimbria major subunit LpfA [Salmonella enterica subsp. enterica serovar Newport]EFS6323007.1 long polar fimbria major subunit LpfA [Salmonella enterica subsp. enterica serovar Newport]
MEFLMKKVVFALSALAVVSTSAFAAESGDGTIKFTGEIVDAPCVVSTDSQNQEVVLGQVKKNIFKAIGDKSSSKPFQIKLEDGDITSNTKVNVSFNGVGDTDDATLVSVNTEAGAATGVGIGIYDNANKLVEMNTGKSTTTLAAGQTVLYYTANYVATKDTVTTGYGNAEVDFNLSYE